MPCNNFKLSESGKVIVEEKKELEILELQNGRYLVDKKYLSKLKKYSVKNLQKTSIYKIVGLNKKGDCGIAAEITDTGKLEEFIGEFQEYKGNCLQ